MSKVAERAAKRANSSANPQVVTTENTKNEAAEARELVEYEPKAEQLPKVEKPRLKYPDFGTGPVLDRSEKVSTAFGRVLGFVLMMTAILAPRGLIAAVVIVLLRMVAP